MVACVEVIGVATSRVVATMQSVLCVEEFAS
jgi:hypothetical protein